MDFKKTSTICRCSFLLSPDEGREIAAAFDEPDGLSQLVLADAFIPAFLLRKGLSVVEAPEEGKCFLVSELAQCPDGLVLAARDRGVGDFLHERVHTLPAIKRLRPVAFFFHAAPDGGAGSDEEDCEEEGAEAQDVPRGSFFENRGDIHIFE